MDNTFGKIFFLYGFFSFFLFFYFFFPLRDAVLIYIEVIFWFISQLQNSNAPFKFKGRHSILLWKKHWYTFPSLGRKELKTLICFLCKVV